MHRCKKKPSISPIDARIQAITHDFRLKITIHAPRGKKPKIFFDSPQFLYTFSTRLLAAQLPGAPQNTNQSTSET